ASTTVFKPGGKHVMLFDMTPGIKPGRAVTLTFTFSNNQRVLYDAPTIAAGAPAPTE
ncbi:copper chaperone PCu(A)C, partial [Listeria monocytogenes]|nr:copper chaperone PCu(A)C [Listeria monocytogenes]